MKDDMEDEDFDNDDLDHDFEVGEEVYWIDDRSKAGIILSVMGDVIVLDDGTDCYAEDLTRLGDQK